MFSAALKSGAAATPSDPDFEYVTMLLHGDGTNGAQNNTFLDSSTNNFTITRNGNTTQGSFSPYGPNWSNFFDGTGDYLSAPSNAAFSPGTGDFTIECWTYLTATTGEGTLFYVNATNGINLFLSISGNWGIARAGVAIDNNFGTPPSFNAWNHLAVSRSGSTIRAFVNGGQVFSGTNTSNYAQGAALIGSSNSFGTVTGYISNFRLVKGTAVYTANFTPSTTPLTAISGTSLLTCADNRFIDDSTNNFTITRNGDVSVQRFSPFAPPAAYNPATIGGSGYFDGNRDYLAAPQSAVFAFDTGDFTIEHWVYGGTQIDAFPRTIAIGPGFSTGSVGLTFDDDDFPGKICFYARDITTSRLLISTTNVNDNAWHHIAVTRATGIFRLYVDGVLQATNNSFPSSSVGSGSQPCIIGGVVSEISGEDFVGYLGDVRIVKGSAVYTGNFTPPTAPLASITNTGLLLNFTNGAIFDNAMMNDLETVGNAQISTSVVKFGTGSMAFDGSGDYLATRSTPNLAFGSGNFTIECWAYANSLGTYNALFAQWPDDGGSANNSYVLESVGSEMQFYWVSGTTFYGPAILGTIATGSWNHWAICRSGNTLYPFKNGVLGATISITQVLNSPASPVTVGGAVASAGGSWNGFIDDLRITKGLARYTANFTPPTTAFPDR